MPVLSLHKVTYNHKSQFYLGLTRAVCVTCVLALCFLLGYPVMEALEGSAYTKVAIYASLVAFQLKFVLGILGEKDV